MKKSLSDWANIAEVISGAAVAITVIFLIIEIRANTEITRVSVYESNINSLMEWRSLLIEDRETAQLWESYTSGEFEELDSTDQLRMLQLVANNLNIYEKAYFAQEYGVLGVSEWSRFERMACVQYGWANQSQMISTLDMIMTDEFMSFLKETCSGKAGWPSDLPTN